MEGDTAVLEKEGVLESSVRKKELIKKGLIDVLSNVPVLKGASFNEVFNKVQRTVRLLDMDVKFFRSEFKKYLIETSIDLYKQGVWENKNKRIYPIKIPVDYLEYSKKINNMFDGFLII